MTPGEKREKNAIRHKRWVEKNLDKLKTYQRDYYLQHREALKSRSKKYYETNREKIRAESRSPEGRKRRRMQMQKQCANSPSFKLKCRIGCRIRQSVKAQNSKKAHRTEELIGCPIQFLKKHLESQFKPGMSWANYGEWHVDHVMPCARFDLSDTFQQKICFHFTNLQPLWAVENLSKGMK